MNNRTPSGYSIPPAGKISALRQRMIDDMTVRNLAPNTMLCYLKKVNYLARRNRTIKRTPSVTRAAVLKPSAAIRNPPTDNENRDGCCQCPPERQNEISY